MSLRCFILVVPLLVSFGCADTTAPFQESPEIVDNPQPVTEYIATAADFGCFLPAAQEGKTEQEKWHRVRNFFINNKTGRTQQALDFLEFNEKTTGEVPVGTVVQLVFFEAMVKRGGDFCPQANGWEFFALDVDDSGTSISARGCTDVVNFANGNCFSCHNKAKPEFDLICERTHGCDPLPVDGETLQNFQMGDPRCPAETPSP